MPTNHLEAGVRLKPGGALLDLRGEINGFARAPRTVTVEKTVEKTIPAATPEPPRAFCNGIGLYGIMGG